MFYQFENVLVWKEEGRWKACKLRQEWSFILKQFFKIVMCRNTRCPALGNVRTFKYANITWDMASSLNLPSNSEKSTSRFSKNKNTVSGREKNENNFMFWDGGQRGGADN